MVIRIIHTYHCRVQYFSLDPWGIVTSAGGYIHWRRSSHLNSTSAHHKPAVSPIQPPDISRTNFNAIVDFDAIQGPSWMPESNYSLYVTDDPSCPQWHVRASRQFLISLMISHFPWVTNIPGNGGFHRNPSISHTAHNKSSNKWVQGPVTALKSSTRSTCGQQHRLKNNESNFPCHKWLVPFSRFHMYSKMTGSNSSNFNVWLVPFPQFSSMTDNVQVMVVSPSWPSPPNGLSIQTGSSQVMWFLRPDRHSGMASPPRLAAPRWRGSSALVITAEWRLHSDWQHPGDVVPPLWPSQLNGLPTQTGNAQVMWFLRPDRHSWMASPPRLAAPRWCGSSALTITAEWSTHLDW